MAESALMSHITSAQAIRLQLFITPFIALCKNGLFDLKRRATALKAWTRVFEAKGLMDLHSLSNGDCSVFTRFAGMCRFGYKSSSHA